MSISEEELQGIIDQHTAAILNAKKEWDKGNMTYSEWCDAIVAANQTCLLSFNSHAPQVALEARIDEQENHVMVGSGNVGCQGCYNAVMYNSDRIDTLKGQYEEE